MHRHRFSLLASLLCAGLAHAEPPPAAGVSSRDERLPGSELSVGVGVLGSANTSFNERWGDLFVTPDLSGRLVLSGFTLEGDALLTVPTVPGGPAVGANITARVGYTGERFSLVLGPTWQLANAPVTQVLPSLRTQLSFGSWGVSAGLFDLHAQAPFHLSVELGNYGVGYVAPIGAQAHARLNLGEGLGLKVEALAFALFHTRVAMLTVSGVYSGAGGAR